MSSPARSQEPCRASRPDRLEVVGRLFGLDPPPARAARVLVAGGDLLAMAEALPGSRFVAVGAKPELAAAAGIGNVEAVRALDEAAGSFDYIVAHGVYSWVPAEAREQLLAACDRLLAPQGLAFLSHQVKPGWRARVVARDIMLYHTRNLRDPRARGTQARAALDFVMRGARPSDQAYRGMLLEQLRAAVAVPDGALERDQLAEVNEGWLFHEVCAQLAAHGLQWVADGDLATSSAAGLPAEGLALLEGRDVVEREQYLDLLTNRGARMTVACRAGVKVERPIAPGRLRGMHVVAGEGAPPELVARRPGSVPVAELEERHDLLGLLERGAIELSLDPEAAVPAAGERPRASRLARLRAGHALPVTNLRHEPVALDDRLGKLLALLDGRLDRAALAARFGAGLDDALAELARRALLLA